MCLADGRAGSFRARGCFLTRVLRPILSEVREVAGTQEVAALALYAVSRPIFTNGSCLWAWMQIDQLKRREFITLIGGAVAAWPVVAHAQQPGMPVIGFLDAGSAADRTHAVAAFRQGLAEADFVENRNVAFEFRWAEGQFERLPGLAADLADRKVAIIAAFGNNAARAA